MRIEKCWRGRGRKLMVDMIKETFDEIGIKDSNQLTNY